MTYSYITPIFLFVLVLLICIFYFRKPVYPSGKITEVIPEVALTKQVDHEPAWGFDTPNPIIEDFTGNNKYLTFIRLETTNGREYVQKIGKDTLMAMYKALFIDPFYQRYLISKGKHKEQIDFFINKLLLPAAHSYSEIVIQYYKEMASELTGLPIETTPVTNRYSWNEEFRKYFEGIVLLDTQLETFVWMYIYMTQDLHLPAELVDYFGVIFGHKKKNTTLDVSGCAFMSASAPYTKGDTIIARNFDWMTPLYDNRPLTAFHHVQDGILSFGYPGMVFCTLSAINKHKVWCSFNNLSYSIGTFLQPNLPIISTDMFFRFKRSTTARELYHEYLDANFDVSIIYFAADQKGSYAVGQRPGPQQTKVTEGTPDDKAFARANKVLNPIWYKKGLADPNGWGSDSLHRQVFMMKQLHDNKGHLDDTRFMHIFQEPLHADDLIPGDTARKSPYGKGPTFYVERGKVVDHTMYQCVYNANTHNLYLRGHSYLEPNYPWLKLDIDQIL